MKWIVALLCISGILSGEAKKASSPPLEKIPTEIEIRFAYLWPEASSVREIYGQGWLNSQLTGTVPFYQGEKLGLRGLNFWWLGGYSFVSGHSSGLYTSTRLQSEQAAVGLKWIYPQSMFRPYAGFAFQYAFVQVHNHSNYVKKHISNTAPGFLAEAGFQLFVSRYVFFDFFASYSYAHFGAPSIQLSNIESLRLDLSNINAGGGIGVKF